MCKTKNVKILMLCSFFKRPQKGHTEQFNVQNHLKDIFASKYAPGLSQNRKQNREYNSPHRELSFGIRKTQCPKFVEVSLGCQRRDNQNVQIVTGLS